MAYGLKYTLSFLSDRGNDYRIEILAKDYQGAPIAKKMGVPPVLNIAQGDGCIQGTSLTFAVQADVDGELQEFYTTDNKKFQVLLYRNGAIMWQGYLLPELYSETYVAPPYDVSLTATDQLATLKDIEYSREDEQVLLQTVLEYLLSHTQLSLPLSYHMQLSMSLGRPMLENVYINQSAYNGSNCYDVLNAILLSMNCRLMQLSNQWLVTSATDSSENYYTERNLEVRPHKTLGQMYVADVYPNGTLGLVNSPALKGATLEYNHIFKKSILKNADCESRVGWEYISHSSDDGRLPGEITSFGKIFKAYCWQLMPKNIQKDASLHLWQDVEMPADDGVTWSLSFKHLFSTNAKLLLLAITHWDDKGVQRRLTGEGWVTQWNNSDVNSYIQVTGTPKSASLAEYSDIEQYEMSTVQFTLPPSNGTLRIGFINSTANYADPLAFAPIYVTQVYFTLGAVSGSAATTTIEPNATMGQEGVVLAMGDDVDSSNAVNVALNTLRRYDGGAIAGWMIGDRQFSSYFSMMLQEYSRYFGQKKKQLQGTIMGVDVLANIYKETYSNTVYRLVSADYNLLADEANVTLEEVLSNFVQFAEQIFATNNSNSFGSPTSGGSFSGGSSSVDTSQLLRRDEAAETYATKAALADVNKEIADINNDLDALNELLNSDVSGVINTWGEIVDFLDEYNESQDLASILSQMNSDIANRVHYHDFEKLQEAVDANYGAIQTLQGRVGIAEGIINSHTADIAANTKAITAIDTRVDALEALGFVLKDGYIYTEKTIVSKGEIISGRRASGTSTDVGGGGISSITAQMIADALGYIPYSSANPAGYINSSALNGYAKLTDIPSLNGYATEQYVTSRGYITGISSKMVTDALGYTPYNSANFTKANIKSTLGIADWALAASKPSYSWSEITGKPSFATVATSGKYSDLSGVPTSLPASDVYAWAKKSSLALADVPNLSSIYAAIGLSGSSSYVALKNGGYIAYSGGDKWSVTNSDWTAAYGILHSNNYGSYALPLSGGTITGPLGISSSTKPTGNIGFWSASDIGFIMAKSSLQFYKANTQEYFDLIHSGNYDSYTYSQSTIDSKLSQYLPLSGGTISGALTLQNSIVVSSGADRKLVLNNTDTESKYQFISFMQENLEYGKLGTAGTDDLRWNNNIVLHSSNYSSYALPLSGGTINATGVAPLIINTSASDSSVVFRVNGNSKTQIGYSPTIGSFIYNYNSSKSIGIKDDGTPHFGNNTLIHSGNIGEQIVTGITTLTGNAINANGSIAKLNSFYSNRCFKIARFSGLSGLGTKNADGLIVNWPLDSSYGQQWYIDDESHAIQTRYVSGGTWSSWKTIAFTDSNVASATKLNTARTIWGQSFDGTGNVDGKIYQEGKWILGCHEDGNLYIGFDTYSTNDTLIYGRNLYFGTYSGYSMLINPSGNVLIGTTTDNGAKLQVNGNLTVTGEVISSRRASSSDRRLKDNITYLDTTDCLAMVRHIRPAEWDWKDNGKHSMGFIAQDVEHLMPYAVTSIKDDKLGEKLNLQYDQFIALAIGGVQAVDNEVERLKAKVEYLENKIKEYEYGNYRN